MIKNIPFYYQNRAKEYDLVYTKPERQIDLNQLHAYLKKAFKNKRVIEVACGTGYWTKTIAESCTHILATDVNTAVLEIARSKTSATDTINFKELDLWQLAKPEILYDSLFGGFIWSHILKKEVPQFLNILKSQLTKNGEMIFVDNKYVEGSNTPISRTDTDGNTYQIRKLQNGEQYEVLKNFPNKLEVANLIKDFGCKMEWIELEYYWILRLKLA